MRSIGTMLILMVAAGLLPGCAIMEVGVSNPIPEMTRIAVIPFVNLSSERAVDGRRFADMYYSELQKIPGFQVIPVGVVETAIVDYQLNLDRPEEVLHLIEILNVDAVVFGAVTEYSPYKPPRIGLQVSWYTNKPFTFEPGLPIDENLRHEQDKAIFEAHKWKRTLFVERPKRCRTPQCNNPNCHDHGLKSKRRQSNNPNVDRCHQEGCRAENCNGQGCQVEANRTIHRNPHLVTRGQSPGHFRFTQHSETQPSTDQRTKPTKDEWERALQKAFFQSESNVQEFDAERMPANNGQVPKSEMPVTELTPMNELPRTLEPQPIMSYTRIFDAANADLLAVLRDYVELNGDLRSGGYVGWTQRSDDFIRFCMHRMVVEMLQLHGGESKRRVIFARRRNK